MHFDRDDVLAKVDLTAPADTLLGPRHARTRSWRCPNPSHSQTGRTPPVSIFVDRRGQQRWHCFGCGEGGTAIDLTLRAGRARDFRDALEWLADQAHVSPSPDDRGDGRGPGRGVAAQLPASTAPDLEARRALLRYAKACFEHLRSDAGREVRRWLVEARALPMAVLDHGGVGADPGSWNLPRPDGIPKVSPAAVFPIREQDEVVYTLSRATRPIRDMPPWVNTASSVAPNPGMVLLDTPSGKGSGPVIVTEGMIDALSVLSAGRPAAALLGTGFGRTDTAEKLAQLRRPLMLATDNDAAGRDARQRLTSLLTAAGADVCQLTVPDRFNDLNDWHRATRTHWSVTVNAAIHLADSARAPEPPPPCLG